MIDFSKGGYKGDEIEEMFEEFTKQHMPHYWYFREVLRANVQQSDWWKKKSGVPLTEEESKELIIISFLMYHIYTCLGESINFDQMIEDALLKSINNGTRIFEVKKNWKAAYSSLYTSLNAMANLSLILAGNKPIFDPSKNRPWNYTPNQAIEIFNKLSLNIFSNPIKYCLNRLEIRNHLDHFWTIWIKIDWGEFKFDRDFTKGHAPISQPQSWIDAKSKLSEDIINTAKDLDSLFFELSRPNGSLDNYLDNKSIFIDYSDYGVPHNGQRPQL